MIKKRIGDEVELATPAGVEILEIMDVQYVEIKPTRE